MTKEMKQTLAAGTYKNGVITLKSGHVITAKQLIAAKKAGLTVEQLLKQIEEEVIVVPIVVEEEKTIVIEQVSIEKQRVVKKPTAKWATISREEIITAGYTKEVSVPWYKRLFGGRR